MAFNVESLLHELFREADRPAAGSAQPVPRQASKEPPLAPSRSEPARPSNRLPGALPTQPLPEWLLLWKKAPEVTLPPKPCWWCGRAVFWLSNFGGVEGYKCGHCHPPAFPSLAKMWLRVVPTEEGPQVVRLGGPPSKG